jgi:hypothetical protein
VELRKVQRLGKSSLVVTLPLEWCKRYNLKPGDLIALVNEGVLLKIIPFTHTKMIRSIELNLLNLKDRKLSFLARFIGPCTYTLGYDRVTLHVKPECSKHLMDIKRSVVKLLGVEVSSLSPESLSYKVLLDSDLLDPRDYIKRLTWIAVKVLDLLAMVFQGLNIRFEEFDELKEEFRVARITAERSLHTWGEMLYDMKEAWISITFISLLSITTSILLDVLEYAMRTLIAVPTINIRSDKLSVIARCASRTLTKLAVIARNYKHEDNVNHVLELVLELEELEKTLIEMLDDPSLDKGVLVVVARLTDAIKMIKIVAYALTCITLVTVSVREALTSPLVAGLNDHS